MKRWWLFTAESSRWPRISFFDQLSGALRSEASGSSILWRDSEAASTTLSNSPDTSVAITAPLNTISSRCRVPAAYSRGDGVGHSGCDGAYFFPRVLIDLIDLEGLAFHRVSWCALIQVGLELVTTGMHRLTRETQFTCESGGRLALGDTVKQEH